MNGLQARMRRWCRRWVPNVTPAVAKIKVREEYNEVLELDPQDPALPQELADAILATLSYAVACNIDLAAEVERKMTRNEHINWIPQPDGTVRWDRDGGYAREHQEDASRPVRCKG